MRKQHLIQLLGRSNFPYFTRRFHSKASLKLHTTKQWLPSCAVPLTLRDVTYNRNFTSNRFPINSIGSVMRGQLRWNRKHRNHSTISYIISSGRKLKQREVSHPIVRCRFQRTERSSLWSKLSDKTGPLQQYTDCNNVNNCISQTSAFPICTAALAHTLNKTD